MSLSRRQCLALLTAGLSSLGAAGSRTLAQRWRDAAAKIDGTVGVAAFHLTTGDRASLRADDRFPLASVCKLPIAMNMLALVDEGKFRLEDLIDVPAQDVTAGVSAIAEGWPTPRRFTLNALLELMVARSDNTAVETLLRIGGGPPAMAARFRQWQSVGIRIDRSERECGLNAAGIDRMPPIDKWTPGMVGELTAPIPLGKRRAAMQKFLADPRDTATPAGTVDLLRRLYRRELLSAASTARLIQILESTTTGRRRLKGMLPAGTVVAHKTGTTGSPQGLNGSTNDVGVITLPRDAGQFAIAVYVRASTRDDAAREHVIATIARITYDFWSATRS